jgi:hypothetical protein
MYEVRPNNFDGRKNIIFYVQKYFSPNSQRFIKDSLSKYMIVNFFLTQTSKFI